MDLASFYERCEQQARALEDWIRIHGCSKNVNWDELQQQTRGDQHRFITKINCKAQFIQPTITNKKDY
tara:strand:+ start:38 stop:241 length:204 start_codon:yes stop_codon:yes gene_type:complete